VLRINIVETATDRRWIVEGRLVGPWVGELRTAWKKACRSQDKRACIIDLNDVTFIDKSGERLLRAMSKKGAQLLAKGLYVKHLLEQLKTDDKRRLIALIVFLFVGLQMNVVAPVTHGQAPAPTESFQRENCRTSSVPLEVVDVIGVANTTSSSADRMARTEDK
jgi:anti-anti-sigma regulatory factor